MNYKTLLLLTASASISLSSMANAAVIDIGTVAYLVDTTLSGNDYQTSTASTTWTINSGITVTTPTTPNTGNDSGRFFISESASGTFAIIGGGTLSVVGNDGYANLRLGGHSNASIVGMVVIAGGSTFELTHADAIIRVSGGGGSITLDGLGSTFSAPGTYDSLTNTFTATNPGGGSGSFTINLANAVSITETTSGGFTTLTAVPEPSSAALLGLGGIALILRRRK